ncbi:MAG: ribonuclease R [Phycisphaerae bacterium]|nr:ribonuclease R [Phycisphaerae bacterium]
MSESLSDLILQTLRSPKYRPLRRRALAKQLNLAEDGDRYTEFKKTLRSLDQQGKIVLTDTGAIQLPGAPRSRDEFVGTYRHNKRGFGFVVPVTHPGNAPDLIDLFIPPGFNGGAINGDLVRAKITESGWRDGKPSTSGRVTEIVERKLKKFVGSLVKQRGEWMVFPDGNSYTDPILTPDAAGKYLRPGTKVVVELTVYPEGDERAAGVITDVLGAAGEKDVDLKGVLIQYNLPGDFPQEVKDQASHAVQTFDPHVEADRRLDLSDVVVCTIDPDDAKDYDDAISLKSVGDGRWELGVHIADVSFFVKSGTPLDVEAKARGNSTYFPGTVIPMLPEVLSNGVCSLQEGVPRLCKSAFITLDKEARPIQSRFANTLIRSRKRLRYREAQAILDGANIIPHPDGDKTISDYPAEVIELVRQMDALAKRIQKRRQHDGQLVLDLPEVELVLDEGGKVVDAVPEDTSFTHTLIEMFMVEANEAVARLLDSLNVPFLRRTHPDPESPDSERLRHFAQITGYALPKEMDRKSLQSLLMSVRDKPEAFAINLAVLRSLTRAEYSPKPIGHFALASEDYCHFTSPIRRYADLTIHRLLDAYFEADGKPLRDVPTEAELIDLGKHISFTERQSDDAERELRRVKLLELMQKKVGEDFLGVITGVTNFGLFIQLKAYLVDGLVRYEDLGNERWEVDERSGFVRGRQSGKKIGVGDVVTARVVRVDLPRRELDLAIMDFVKKTGHAAIEPAGKKKKKGHRKGKAKHTGGETKRNLRSKRRSR